MTEKNERGYSGSKCRDCPYWTDRCEWSLYSKPVPGWKTSSKKAFARSDGKQAYTYKVTHWQLLPEPPKGE